MSPVEIVQSVFDRIQEVNPSINAFCALTEEQALGAARKAELAVMRGDSLGDLHGLPVSIKDLLLTRGVRTVGSRIRETYVPEEDAPSVEKLIAAGGIVTDSPLMGITRNPWDLSKAAGGSSGGAGAAVSAGLGPLALGTDGAGSIRIPSSFNDRMPGQ